MGWGGTGPSSPGSVASRRLYTPGLLRITASLSKATGEQTPPPRRAQGRAKLAAVL